MKWKYKVVEKEILKYKYMKTFLKYSIWVNVLSCIPSMRTENKTVKDIKMLMLMLTC